MAARPHECGAAAGEELIGVHFSLFPQEPTMGAEVMSLWHLPTVPALNNSAGELPLSSSM